MVAILVLFTLVAFLTVDYLVQRREARKAGESMESAAPVFRIPWKEAPRGLLFDRTHQWLELGADGLLKVGLDPFPTALLGRAFKVLLPRPGRTVRAGEPLLTLTKGSRNLSISSPVDGEIEAVNSAVEDEPGLLQDEPYGAGWLYRIRPKHLDAMLLAERAVGEDAFNWLRGEYHRLRQFIGAVPLKSALAGATLQDGGEPVEGLAAYVGDEAWERLKAEFFG